MGNKEPSPRELPGYLQIPMLIIIFILLPLKMKIILVGILIIIEIAYRITIKRHPEVKVPYTSPWD